MSGISNGINNFNNSLNNAVGKVSDVTQGAVQLGQALNGLNNAVNGYPTDTYTTQSTAQPVNGAVPLKSLFAEHTMNYPNPLENKLADRLAFFGVSDSKEFVSAASAPWKRTMMSFLVGFGNDRQYIRAKIDQWAGQADLVRAGASTNDAKLLQMSGVGDVIQLAQYGNPIDKGALYAKMGANAMQYGFNMPNFGAVSSAVDRARSIPPVIRWQ
ncbi:MAG: hypothetical protein AABZ74_11465 [Cyanobacteriota bacterium]